MNWVDYAIGGTLALLVAWLSVLAYIVTIDWQARREQQRRVFAELRHLLEALNNSGLRLDTLSMGMSRDMELAIAEGSTLVRIGSDIFGPRT